MKDILWPAVVDSNEEPFLSPVASSSNASTITDNKEPYFSLGKSLRLLLDSRQHLLDNAIDNVERGQHRVDVTTQALYSLDMHLSPTVASSMKSDQGQRSTQGSTTTLLENACMLLQERLADKKSNKVEREAAFRLLAWLLQHPMHGPLLKRFLCQTIRNNDKRKKLAIVEMLQQLWLAYSVNAQHQHATTEVLSLWHANELLEMVEALTWSIDADSLWINQQKQATRLTEACTILTMYVTSTWAAGCLAISAPINNVKSNRMIVVMDDDDENEDSKEIDRLECFAKAIPSLIVLVDHLRGDTWLQVQGKQQLRNRLMVEQTNCQQMTSLTKKYDAIRRTADLWIKVASALDTEVIRMSRSKYIQRLEASIDKARHQNTSDHLLELILLLGRRKASFIDELLRPAHKSDSGACDIHDALLGLVSAAVISSNEEIVDLAFIIIRRIIMASTDSLATMKELIEPLMDMSNNDDAVSRSITGLLTEMSIQFPQQILGQILGRLKCKDRVQQRNALSILKSIAMHSEAVSIVIGQTSQLSELQDLLLDVLTVDDIELRNVAASLFRFLPYDDTMSSLTKRLASDDERIRSSGELALLDILLHHSAGIDVMMAFLGFVRKSFNSSTSTNIRTQNAMAHIITKWSQQIPQQIWTEFIPMLIHATYEYADNRGMIMIWRTISHIWMKVPTIIPIAVEGVMKIINKQNSDSRAIVTEQDMQTQLCNRLCPLLILKTMPNEVFDHAKMESNENTMNMIANLREIILQRCEDEQDALAIRRIAFEVLVKLPDVFPIISQKLTALVKDDQQNQLVIRNWLFALHQYVTHYFGRLERVSVERHKDEKRGFIRMIMDVVLPLIQKWSLNDHAQEITFACLDTFSVLLACSIINEAVSEMTSISSSMAPFIVELTDESDEPARLFAYLLDRLLVPLCATLSTNQTTSDSNVEIDNDPMSLAICMANILIMTARRLSGQSMAEQTTANTSSSNNQLISMPSWISEQDQLKAQCLLANHTMSVLFPAMQHRITHGQSDPLTLNRYNRLLASCLQYMFHYAFLYKSELTAYYENMADIAIHLLTSCPLTPEPVCIEARQQSIKLLLAIFMPRHQPTTTMLVIMTPWRLSRLRQLYTDITTTKATSIASLEHERYLLMTLLSAIDTQ